MAHATRSSSQLRILRETNLFESGTLVGGLLTGMAAGAGMIALVTLFSAVVGQGFFFPLKVLASSFFGVRALIGGAGAVFAGLGLHFFVSAVWGVIFSLISQKHISFALSFFEGVAFGLVVWFLMTYIVAGSVSPIVFSRIALVPVWWFVAHIFFGALFVLNPPIRKWVADREGATT